MATSRTRWSRIVEVRDAPAGCACHDKPRGCERLASVLVVVAKGVGIALCDDHYRERGKWDDSRGHYELEYEDVV